MSSKTSPKGHSAEEWNERWRVDQERRSSAKDVAHWNQRAATFDKPDTPDSYVEAFLQRAAIREGESVFDMGCGTGGLAVPLGAMGHRVLAADFSTGMLERLQEKLDAEGIASVETLVLSWADDWESRGVLPDSWDVSIASRSLITDDLLESLRKLSSVARRRVCVTVGADCMPRVDERILPVIGLEAQPCNDELFTVRMVEALGYQPEVSYIRSERIMTFADEQEALERYLAMAMIALGSQAAPLTDGELQDMKERLSHWLEDNLVAAPGPDAPHLLTLKEPRITRWAFIGWDVDA